SKKDRFSSKGNPLSNEVKITSSLIDLNNNNNNPKTGIVKTELNRFSWLKNEFNAILSIGIIQGLATK
ncbi:unnamed protein product, partial [marine sediment metagenome]